MALSHVLAMLTMLAVITPCASADTVQNPPENQRTYSTIFDDDAPGGTHGKSMIDSTQAWTAKTQAAGQWMTIDLGSTMFVKGVVTQGRASAGQWVKSYTIQYATDSSGAYTTINSAPFTGNTGDGPTKVQTLFAAGVNARYIRFVMVASGWNSFISMRAGVLTGKAPSTRTRTTTTAAVVVTTKPGTAPAAATTTAKPATAKPTTKATAAPAVANVTAAPAVAKATTKTTSTTAKATAATAKPTTKATAAPAVANVTAPAVAVAKVQVSFTFKVLNFTKLTTAVKTAITGAVVDNVLKGLGAGYTKDHVEVVLKAGSVIAEVTITPLNGTTVAALSTAMTSTKRDSIAASVTTAVKAVPNIETVLTTGSKLADLATTHEAPVIITPPSLTTAKAKAAPGATSDATQTSSMFILVASLTALQMASTHVL